MVEELQKMMDRKNAADLDARNKKNSANCSYRGRTTVRPTRRRRKLQLAEKNSWDKVWNWKKGVWEWTAYQWMMWWKSTGWVMDGQDGTWTPPPDSDGWWQDWRGWHHSGDGKGKGSAGAAAGKGKGEGGWARTASQSWKRSEPKLPQPVVKEVGILKGAAVVG